MTRVRKLSALLMLGVVTTACGGDGTSHEPRVTGGAGAGTNIMGGSSGLGGASTTGGNTNSNSFTMTGGTTSAAGTLSTGGTASTGNTIGPGCSGTLEEIQVNGGLCVSKMVAILGPASDAGNTDYKIDATEVTRSQYAAWLATNPSSPSSDDANCGWNAAYAPDSSCMASSFVCQTNCDHHPQVCIDWCDASAYCAGVGKRLCGAIAGGSNAFGSFNDPNLSQWHRVCTSGGKYLGTYGDTPDDTKCNEYTHWAPNYDSATTLQVASLPGCQSPVPEFAGVYDLNGNVWEWENSCDAAGQAGKCRTRGVGFWYYANLSGCAADSSAFRYDAASGVGFRCCSR